MTHWYDLYFGWFLLILGSSYFLRANQWLGLTKKLITDSDSLYLLWILFLGFGLVIIANHNIWVWQWHVAVTVVGWSLTIKSAAYLLLPIKLDYFSGWSDKTLHRLFRISGAVMTTVGLMLIWQS